MGLVTVEFLAPYADSGGARFNARERAGLPPEVAADLVARGVVRLLLKEPGQKAPSGPPGDKMERGKEKKRGRYL